MTEEKEPPDPHRLLRVAVWLFAGFAMVMVFLLGAIVADGRERDTAQDQLEDGLEQVQAALDQFEADRIDRSVNACQDRNDIRIRMNRLALTAAGHDVNGQPTDVFVNASPERQATAREFLSNLLPLQVCTSDAIDRYVASGRTEGIVPIDGADGYSEAVTQP